MGSFEFYRKFDGSSLKVERQTVHISDDTGRIAMLEKRTIGTAADDNNTDATLVRYIYSNHLQSANLELDKDANIISYEEYHPYGTTSYQAMNTSIKATAKRYRYTGKERDDESGLYYHGARYYIPWLARWTAIDPMEAKYAALSPYNYSFNNPVMYNDPSGADPGTDEPTKVAYKDEPWLEKADRGKSTIDQREFRNKGGTWYYRGKEDIFLLGSQTKSEVDKLKADGFIKNTLQGYLAETGHYITLWQDGFKEYSNKGDQHTVRSVVDYLDKTAGPWIFDNEGLLIKGTPRGESKNNATPQKKESTNIGVSPKKSDPDNKPTPTPTTAPPSPNQDKWLVTDVADAVGNGTIIPEAALGFVEHTKTGKFLSSGYQTVQTAEEIADFNKVMKLAKPLTKGIFVINVGVTATSVFDDWSHKRYKSAGARAAVWTTAALFSLIPGFGWAIALGIGIADAIWGDKFYNLIENFKFNW